jgi:hypothetical protein
LLILQKREKGQVKSFCDKKADAFGVFAVIIILLLLKSFASCHLGASVRPLSLFLLLLEFISDSFFFLILQKREKGQVESFCDKKVDAFGVFAVIIIILLLLKSFASCLYRCGGAGLREDHRNLFHIHTFFLSGIFSFGISIFFFFIILDFDSRFIFFYRIC